MANPNNALDVLINALPNEQADRLASQLSITRSIARPTTFTTISSTTQTTSSLSSSTLTSSNISSSTVSSSSTTSTASTPPTSSSSPSLEAQPASSSASATPAPPAGSSVVKSAGAIAGITAGSIAAAVLIILIALYCFTLRRRRRRQQQQQYPHHPHHHKQPANTSRHAPHGSASSLLSSIKNFGHRKPVVYPEVAWLYDPVRPNSQQQAQAPRDFDGDLPLGANAPWSSRPSTSMEPDRGRSMVPAMAELSAGPLTNNHMQQHHLQQQAQQQQQFGPGMFISSDRDRSPSQPAGFRRFSRPFVPIQTQQQRREPENDDLEDSISPLLPAPAPTTMRDPPRQESLDRDRARTQVHDFEQSSFYSSEASPARVDRAQRRSFMIDPPVDGRSPVRKMGRAF